MDRDVYFTFFDCTRMIRTRVAESGKKHVHIYLYANSEQQFNLS
jgi:hypothetical protein